ncbi:MAG: hypothetical protein K9N39_02630 [Candidatus Cloacimonetes bacterium]|nr:hypothetical protein [Candidatus Cloacimonadota bacterium]
MAKNKSLNLLKSQKRNINVDPIMLNQAVNYDNPKKSEFAEILSEVPKSIISEKDRKLLKHTFKRGIKFAARDLNQKENSFRIKIYRLRQEIILFYKLKNDVKSFDPIPGTKLHYNLMNCIKRIQKSLSSMDYSFLSEFELDVISFRRLEETDISEIIKYQIDIIKKGLYEVFVFYFQADGHFNSIRFEISVDKFGKLQMLTFPQLPKKIVKINNQDIPKDLCEKLKPLKDGTIPLTKEDLNRELTECVQNIEVVYDIEEVE